MQSTQWDDAKDDANDLADRARREVDDAKTRLSDAADRVRSQASDAGNTIVSLVYDELDRRGSEVADGLRHIAQTVRESNAPDGGPPRMVLQAVDVLDDLSSRLKDGSARDLGARLADFGRSNPTTFMLAALATGVLAGRFLIAQDDSADHDSGPYSAHKTADDWRTRPDRTGQDRFAASETYGSGMSDEPHSDLDLSNPDMAGDDADALRAGGSYDRP